VSPTGHRRPITIPSETTRATAGRRGAPGSTPPGPWIQVRRAARTGNPWREAGRESPSPDSAGAGAPPPATDRPRGAAARVETQRRAAPPRAAAVPRCAKHRRARPPPQRQTPAPARATGDVPRAPAPAPSGRPARRPGRRGPRADDHAVGPRAATGRARVVASGRARPQAPTAQRRPAREQRPMASLTRPCAHPAPMRGARVRVQTLRGTEHLAQTRRETEVQVRPDRLAQLDGLLEPASARCDQPRACRAARSSLETSTRSAKRGRASLPHTSTASRPREGSAAYVNCHGACGSLHRRLTPPPLPPGDGPSGTSRTGRASRGLEDCRG